LARISKAYRLKLYPNRVQKAALARYAGACRWLWNHLLAMQQERYGAEKKFIFRFEMQKLLPGLKKEFPWLAEAPVHSLQRVCRNLHLALKGCFRNGKGFPRFKKKGVSRESFYVSNDTLRVEENRIVLPKLGPVKFRCGPVPEGKLMGATVSFDGRSWWCTVQCEQEAEVHQVAPEAETVVGIDLGLKDLITTSDGQRVKAPKNLRKAQKRLRRAQRMLARRRKGSANRRKQAARVAAVHRKVRDRRRDLQHKTTAALVGRASAVVTEDPNIRGMIKNRRLAMSFADAGWGEMLRQVAYKCEWAGKAHVMAGRFEPSTQTCSSCGTRKTGEEKLSLQQRTYRCGNCGLEMDRDLNAALNLRRLGLAALGLEDVGQAMPELAGEIRLPADACGDASAGEAASAASRYVSRKQESSDQPQMTDSQYANRSAGAHSHDDMRRTAERDAFHDSAFAGFQPAWI